MDPQLEALLKAWEAYDTQPKGSEADRLLAIYESTLANVAAARGIPREALHRAVKSAYRRWQWADDPKFPRALRNTRLD